MAKILDPKTAANEIRDRVVRPNVAPDPMDQHSHNFVIAVCQELGVDPTPTNFTTVISALKDADIQPHQMVEYPKMLTDDKSKPVVDDFGRPVVFQSREDEDAYNKDNKNIPEPKLQQSGYLAPNPVDVDAEGKPVHDPHEDPKDPTHDYLASRDPAPDPAKTIHDQYSSDGLKVDPPLPDVVFTPDAPESGKLGKDDSQQKHAAYPTVEDVTTKNPSVPNPPPGAENPKIEPEGKAPKQPAPNLPKR